MSGYNKKPRKSRGNSVNPSGSGRGRSGVTGSSPRVDGRSVTTYPLSESGSLLNGPLGQGFGGSVNPLNGATYDGSVTGKNWGKDFLYPILNGIQGSQSGSILDFLTANGISLTKEQQDAMYQFLLQYMSQIDQRTYDQQLTQDKRSYEWSLLQDARIYDNPMNQLARLMGAGISRDAAFQILSGSGASASGGLGAGAGTPVSNQPTAAGSVPAVSGTQNLNIANTVMSGVQLISNLVGQGFGLAQAVEQTKMLRNQSYMSDAQVSAFQGINEITNAFNNAVFDGTLSVDDIQGLRSADDYYRYITDHADTNLIKPLIQSGAVKRAFGSTIGRNMMNQHLESVRQGRDADKLFDNYLRSTELANDLQEVNVVTQYQEVSKGIYDILMKEPELLSRWQELMSQAQEYEIRSLYKTEEEYNAYIASKQLDVAQRVFEPASNGGIGSGNNTGVEMLAFTQWRNLHNAQVKALAEHEFGDDYWTKFYQSNVRTAVAVQFLKENQAEFAKISLDPKGPNPFWASILNTIKILNESGAWNATDQFFNAANTGLNAFDTFNPVKPQ